MGITTKQHGESMFSEMSCTTNQ